LKLNRLKIRNFRNFKKIDYKPSPGLNILVGDNAQGKTNLLEAIYVLATGSSFRKTADAHLLRFGEAGFALEGQYEIGEREIQAFLEYSQNGNKNFLINNKKSNLGHKDRLRVVLFNPDDLFLVKGSPGKRRAFLDFLLKQISPEYNYNLDNYVILLKKRNLFLRKDQTTGKSFRIINDLFVEKACQLVLQRINFINILDEISREVYWQTNQQQNELKTRYALSFAIDSDKINMNVLQQSLHQHIEKHLREETQRGRTLAGPHLEDINFYQDGKLARIYASQGQQRNIAISLKLAELKAYKQIKDEYPIFLLDEVLSELDETKRGMLINILEEAGYQTFLTSVRLDRLEEARGTIEVVEEGRFLRKGI